MFRCCSFETSHPRLLPQSLKDCFYTVLFLRLVCFSSLPFSSYLLCLFFSSHHSSSSSASHCCVLFLWILFLKSLFCLHLTSSSINFFIASSHMYIIYHSFPQLAFRLGPSSTIVIYSFIFSYNKALDLIKRTIY